VLLDGPGNLEVRAAEPADAGELYVLQLACWVAEQHDNPGVRIPALHETYDDLRAWLARDTVLVARSAGRLVGAVRASLDGDAWEVGRLMVAPDVAGRGLGRALLERIEALVPAAATTYALFTGAGSLRNQRMYKKAGYRLRGEIAPGVVRMTKPVR
jgi:tRNA (guanine37-N1)-methyltransferase